MHSSGEWFWVENGNDVENHNGSLNSDHIVYAFIFEEIMRRYGVMKNYEEFYDFLIQQKDEWYKEVFDTASENCAKELNLESDNGILSMFRTYQYKKIIEIFNYLIIDTLRVKISNSDLLAGYNVFLDFFKRYESITIYTLNHDLLLERLFDIVSRPYSDGFSSKNSTIIGDDDIPQPSFQNIFTESTRLLKLHGSDGLYQYPAGVDDGGIVHRTGEVIYFKPTSYHNKHVSKRIDTSGKILQTLNLDTSPKFITGKNKNGLIQKDPMYQSLYSDFKNELRKGNDLVIVGYSYLDDHINSVIEAGGPYQNVINVNPGKTYPYSNAKKVTNVDYLSALAPL